MYRLSILQVVKPGYDALVTKSDTMILLLDQTIGNMTANAAATATLADAMTTLLGAVAAATTQFLNTAEVLKDYTTYAEYAAYSACIEQRIPDIKFVFKLDETTRAAALEAQLGAPGRRRLAQAGQQATGNYSEYNGYVIFDAPSEEYLLSDTVGRYRPRYAGMKGNTVFGGLFLHQVRRKQAEIPSNTSQQCTSLFSSLSIACQPRVMKRIKSVDLGPIGVDPVFLTTSSLYRQVRP